MSEEPPDLNPHVGEEENAEPHVVNGEEKTPELTPEQQQTRKAIIDDLAASLKIIEERKDNPRTLDYIQKAKLEALIQQAHAGKFSEPVNYTWTMKGGESYMETISIDEFYKNISRVAEEKKQTISQGTSNAISALNAIETKLEDDSWLDQRRVQEQEETEPSSAESWLDPRRIQELKSNYEALIKAKEDELGGVVSQEFKDIAKTHVIEKAVRETINAGKFVQKKHGVGKTPGAPTEEIKQQIAQLLDKPLEEINNMAQQTDEDIQDIDAPFKIGQEVRKVNSKGEVDEGWQVDGFYKHYGGSDLVVISKQGKDQQFIPPSILSEWQRLVNPDQEKLNLEKLKPYIDNPAAKVKLENGNVVEGEFRGYSSTRHKVYVADADGNLLPNLVDTDEFLDWQSEKTTEETAQEEAAEEELAKSPRKLKEQSKIIDGRTGKVFIVEHIQTDEEESVATLQLEDDKDTVLNIGLENLQTQLDTGSSNWRWPKKGEAEKEETPPSESTTQEQSKVNTNGDRESGNKVLESLSWWETTVKKIDSLPAKIRIPARALGWLSLIPGPGLAVGAGLVVQHKLHKKQMIKQETQNRTRGSMQ